MYSNARICYDVFITNDDFNLETIPSDSVIGTSSLRRAVQISRKRSDLKVKPVRGNIETRINKVIDGKFDAVVLAHAGISRLDLDVKYSMLPTADFPPSPGQGALAIVCRAEDDKTITMLKKIEDKKSRAEIEAERALSEYVESGCRFPVGALAVANSSALKLTVTAYSVDGKISIKLEKTGDVDKPKNLGQELGEELKKSGIAQIASNWRESLDEWNKK
jgi:hydroxymethylbilane synthase